MKIAVYGVWHVHAPEYTKRALEHAEVIGFYEKDDALAEQYAQMFDIPRFKTPEELLASDADGVIVCSASCDHAEDIIKIANAKKNIFTEKVLALTDEDCDRIEKAVEKNGVSFTISLFQKYLASRIAVKEIADSGELGKINYLRFRNCHSGSIDNWLPNHFYNARECGGGAMIDLGAHGMYLTEWILGVPAAAKSTFTISCDTCDKNTDRVEDNAVTVMSYENGAIAINETGFVSRHEPVIFEVHGENGYVLMEDDRVIKRTTATGGKTVEVALKENIPQPIVQFVTGKPLAGCAMREAKALTRMMTLAYAE